MIDWKAALFLFYAIALTGTPPAQGDETAVPAPVRELVGTFAGEWVSYGIDETHQPVMSSAWTDTMTASNPVVSGGRAFVTTSDRMTFAGGQIPPMTIPGSEGYILNDDGSLGDYFFTSYGQTYRMQKLDESTWVYVMPAAPQELGWLGFPTDARGKHVMVKVVNEEDGRETHRISRISTIHWNDAGAGEQWVQYTSLKGYHQKIRP